METTCAHWPWSDNDFHYYYTQTLNYLFQLDLLNQLVLVHSKSKETVSHKTSEETVSKKGVLEETVVDLRLQDLGFDLEMSQVKHQNEQC